MIYTSDNEIYEDSTAHALGVKHPSTVDYSDHLAGSFDSRKIDPDKKTFDLPILKPEPVSNSQEGVRQGIIDVGEPSDNERMLENLATNPQASPDIDFMRKGIKIPTNPHAFDDVEP